MAAKQGKLNTAQQAYVVQCLACFDTVSTVRDNLKKVHGVEVSAQAIEAYDPGKHAGRNLAERWKTLYADTRKAFLEDTSDIAVSHRAVRLRSLQRMIEKAENGGNMVLAAQLIEQAAKEMGNAFTNRRELTGAGGKDLPTPVTRVEIVAAGDDDSKD